MSKRLQAALEAMRKAMKPFPTNEATYTIADVAHFALAEAIEALAEAMNATTETSFTTVSIPAKDLKLRRRVKVLAPGVMLEIVSESKLAKALGLTIEELRTPPTWEIQDADGLSIEQLRWDKAAAKGIYLWKTTIVTGADDEG